ncbi:MAG TPA: HEAT repeat domain-containing protein [Bryobacteraceae bacterium]|nr:HEAT repeat domain-containing protein [Bryobacteraceae bacterium]
MRYITALLSLAALVPAQSGFSPAGPKIGIIDFYGLHKVSQATIAQALETHVGDPLPRSKAQVEERIDQIPGVVQSHLEAVCCEEGRMILYVGIEEKGAPHFDLRETPDGDADLPEEVADLYRKLEQTSPGASREDLTHGYALSANPDARAIQEQFPLVAKRYTAELRHVIHDSSDDDQRAVAVYVIGYAPDRTSIINDLQYALKDPDAGVRANAAHALRAMAVYARLHPEEKLRLEPTWFVEMLNSLWWADRHEAVEMLLDLTDSRDESTLQQIRERALGSLIEMAQWKALTHALPAFLLLGRVAGMPDQQVQGAWTRGDRESVIALAMKKGKK